MNPDQRADLLATATRLAERAADTADRLVALSGSLDEREQARLGAATAQARLGAATAQALAAIVQADALAGAVNPGGDADSIAVYLNNAGDIR